MPKSIENSDMAANHSSDGSDERGFLHDLATPLGAAIFLTDSVLEDLRSRVGTDPDDVLRLAGISQALERVNILLRERRELLIKRGVPSARS
jgi:hypothetical protein